MKGQQGERGEGLLIVRADEVASLLAGREAEVLDAVRRAYLAHGRGESCLPHSTFVRFPDDEVNRIIALPGYLGDGFQVAGMKWIASFPGNLERHMARASALMVLNSTRTGHPEAVLEGSLISAQRTAASAALAASVLVADRPPEVAGMIGTGLINLEIARFLRHAVPSIRRFVLHDLDRDRAERFGARLAGVAGPAEIEVADDAAAVLRRCPLVVFATTAVHPHVDDLSGCPPGATLLHVSLRDLSAGAILSADNVVDDPDHVCRARTSVQLAEEASGGRGFIRCTLSDILSGTAPARIDEEAVTVFSPFGLGVLDLAVGAWCLAGARASGVGTLIPGFLPAEGLA